MLQEEKILEKKCKTLKTNYEICIDKESIKLVSNFTKCNEIFNEWKKCWEKYKNTNTTK